MTTPRRRVAFLGFGDYPNIIKTVTTNGTVAPGLPLSNLLTEEPSEIARVLTNDPRYAIFAGGNFLFGDSTWDTVAMTGIKASPWALWRTFTQGFGSILTPPTGTAAPTNITGAVSNVDEDPSDGNGVSQSDSNFIVPTDTTLPWSVRITFATPALSVATGANRAYFLLRVGGVYSDVAYPYPSITVSLYESGVLKRFLGKRAVTQSNQLLIFSFDMAELSDPAGTNVEALVESRPFHNSTPVTNYAKLDSIGLVNDHVSTTPLLHSGWMSVPWANTDAARPVPTKSLAYFASAAVADGVYVQIMDDQTDHFPSTYSDSFGIDNDDVKLTPSGYTEAGIFIAGQSLFLENGLLGDPKPKVLIEGSQGNTVGGQTYAADMFRRRSVSANLIITEDELNILTAGIDWERGHAGAFFAAMRANLDAQYQQWDAGWWTMVDASEPQQAADSYTAGGSQLFTKQYTFEEKL